MTDGDENENPQNRGQEEVLMYLIFSIKMGFVMQCPHSARHRYSQEKDKSQ